ncbi:MAG: alpha/beta hydrolase [Bernardetiaceae bacterium]|nr:alpha/beta hydrolase [Bernardetiaceae bacterium]
MQTIVPSLLRKVTGVRYQRERIDTPDGDFLDLDWATGKSNRLVIVTHGLEGSSQRHYVKGLIKALYAVGWDGLAWNCRSCSGEINRLPRFYHHGDTSDLELVVQHAIAKGYKHILLAGFSLGGSITLKYLGERGLNVAPQIKKGLAVSVPCDLASCSKELSKPQKIFYTNKFLRRLEKKIKLKSQLMPEKICYADFKKVRVFKDFDNLFTAPLHGFRDADDYYASVSSKNFLDGIRIPTLLISALNDPFLTDECFPKQQAAQNPYLHLELTTQGGHVGFQMLGTNETYVERRAVAWVKDIG